MARKRAPRKKSGLAWFMGLVQVTAAIAALILVSAGIAYRLIGLQTEAASPRTPEPDEMTEDKQLFRDLLRTGVLTPRSDGGLDLKPSDHLLRVAAHGGGETPPGVTQREQARFISMLYHRRDSYMGQVVQQQVRLWNDTRRIAGIRDDRPVAANDNRQLWRAETDSGHPLGTSDMVPETFGFIHGELPSTGFGRWVTMPGSRKTVTFRSRISVPSRRTVTVQVVGNPVKVPAGARVVRKSHAFHETTRLWPCTETTRAASVSFEVAPEARGVPVEIVVEPAVNCAPRMYGLAISMSVKDRAEALAAMDRYERAHRDWKRQPRGRAEPEPPKIEWVYNWRPVERSRNTTERRFAIRTADGVPLTDPDGRGNPTERAHALGLLPLVGFGPADAASLIGIIGNSTLPREQADIGLTIDSRLQRATQETVNHYFGTVFPAMGGTRFADERKGAIALLDADTGAILAIGGWPQPPANATPWDYVSFAAANPLRDPMSIFAWEVIDKHNTPGSTMKPLVALALIAARDERLNSIMTGLSMGEIAARTGLNPGSGTYNVGGTDRTISNFGHSPLSQYFNSTNRSPDCVDRGEPTTTVNNFGVKPAMQFSINVWFARLAVMLDQETVDSFIENLREQRSAGKAPPIITSLPDTNLLKSMRSVGIDDSQRMDLTVNVPEHLGLYRETGSASPYILHAQNPRTHITSGERLFTDFVDQVRVAFLHRVGLNGIGQGWSVSALHMARGVASIASGKKVQPHIFTQWGPHRLDPPPAPTLQLDEGVLNMLRLGMKAVPEAPGSTAVSIFREQPYVVDGVDMRDTRAENRERRAEALKKLEKVRAVQGNRSLACRSYGKTGTADIAANLPYNSSWFIGWKDPLQAGGRRIAFACMTTHAIGNFRFGGTACGRVVRDILHSIEITEAETILKARDGGPDGGAEKKDGDTTPDPGNIRPGPDGPRDGGGTPRDPDDLRPRND